MSDENADAAALALPYRPPFAWDALYGFLAARALPGVEVLAGGVYRRAVTIGRAGGGESAAVVEVRHDAGGHRLLLGIEPRSAAPELPRLAPHARRMFDLDADPAAVAERLGGDPLLAGAIAARPGLRLPGAWNGFELAMRAILGQQVSVRAAVTLAGRLVERYGRRLEELSEDGPRRLFPRPEDLAGADLGGLGVTRARAATLRRLAAATAAGELAFDGSVATDELCRRLVALPGIGDWTAQYVAMRALGAADAFPASDLGLMRAVAGNGGRVTPARLLARAERWRPWRAYAAICLWTMDPAMPPPAETGAGGASTP